MLDCIPFSCFRAVVRALLFFSLSVCHSLCSLTPLNPPAHVYSEAPQVALLIITRCPAQISFCSSEIALETRSVPFAVASDAHKSDSPNAAPAFDSSQRAHHTHSHTPTVNHRRL